MGRILRPYNPLVYPGGRLPGFDPSHPLAAGMSPGHGISAMPAGTNFVNLMTGKPGVPSGLSTPGPAINAKLGPILRNLATDNAQSSFPGQNSTFADPAITVAVFIPSIVTTLASIPQFFANNTAVGANQGIDFGLGTAGRVEYNVGSGGNLFLTFPSGAEWTSGNYFLIVSFDANGSRALRLNLDTGQIETITGAGATMTTALNGTYTVGAGFYNPAWGGIGAMMYAPVSTSLAAMAAVAADPWAFWYPSVRMPVLFSGLRGPAAGGSSTLTAAGGTFTLTGEASLFEQFLAASSGPFTLTGEASLFEQFLAASSGSFTLTGEAAAFFLSGGLAAAGATFTLTGEASLFEQFLASAAGAFVLTGGAATLTWALPAAGAGTFAETGEPATFKEALTSAAGAFTETGFAALLGAPAQAFIVAGGTFIFTGFASIELLSSGWRNAIPAVTQWSSATKPASNWTLEPPVVPWSRG